MTEALLTVGEAAERLKMHPDTLRRHLRRGEIRAVKRGPRLWRIPESALEAPNIETSATSDQAAKLYPMPFPNGAHGNAEAIWQQMTSGKQDDHNAALRTLFAAPDEVRAIIAQRSADAAAAYYATPEGEAELADWRALDGEPFEDDAGDYYSAEEEAQFRAERDTQRRAEAIAG